MKMAEELSASQISEERKLIFLRWQVQEAGRSDGLTR
jgi:hypothetical protein